MPCDVLSRLPLDVWGVIFDLEPDDEAASEQERKGRGKRKRAAADFPSRPWSGAALLRTSRTLRAVAQHHVARCAQGRRWIGAWYVSSRVALPWLLDEEDDAWRREEFLGQLRSHRRWQKVPTAAGWRSDPREWACIASARAPSQWLPAVLYASDERCFVELPAGRAPPSGRDVVKSLAWYTEDTRSPVPAGRVRALSGLCRGAVRDALRVAALAEEAPAGEDDAVTAARLLPLVRRSAAAQFPAVEDVLVAAARAMDSVKAMQMLIGAHARQQTDVVAKREPYEAQLRRALWSEFLGKWFRAYFPPRLVEWLVLFDHDGETALSGGAPSIWRDGPRQRDRLCAHGTLATVAHAARHLFPAVDARMVVAALSNPDARVPAHLLRAGGLSPSALLDAVLEHARLLDASLLHKWMPLEDGELVPPGRRPLSPRALASVEALCAPANPRPTLRYAYLLPDEAPDRPIDAGAVAEALARLPLLAARRLLRQRSGTQAGAQVALALATRLRGGAPADTVDGPAKADYLLALRQPRITEALTMF